jgi:hypothetical protein
LATTALFLIVGSAGGCLGTQLGAGSTRPVDTKMDVFVRSQIERHMMDKICILPFSAPPDYADVALALTSAFQTKLTQRRPFREAVMLRDPVNSDTEALWFARSEGCELAMVPVLIFMNDGTGALPTKLEIRIRILDSRTAKVLWDVRQYAQSEPGADLDLAWYTIGGMPARRCRAMGDLLADQFADSLVPPPQD